MRLHPPVQGLVGSIINQPSGQYMCINYVFLCRFWMLHYPWWAVVVAADIWTSWYCQGYATARRWWTASISSSETLFAPERSRLTMEKLPGDWIIHKETGARSFPGDNPNARPFACIVVSSESHEYTELIPPSNRKRGATTGFGQNRHHRSDTASSF